MFRKFPVECSIVFGGILFLNCVLTLFCRWFVISTDPSSSAIVSCWPIVSATSPYFWKVSDGGMRSSRSGRSCLVIWPRACGSWNIYMKGRLQYRPRRWRSAQDCCVWRISSWTRICGSWSPFTSNHCSMPTKCGHFYEWPKRTTRKGWGGIVWICWSACFRVSGNRSMERYFDGVILCSIGRLIGLFRLHRSGWFIDSSIYRLIDLLLDWSGDWWIYWLIDCTNDGVIDWWIDWFVSSMILVLHVDIVL